MRRMKKHLKFLLTIICFLFFDEIHSIQSCSAIITWERAQKTEGEKQLQKQKATEGKGANRFLTLTLKLFR